MKWLFCIVAGLAIAAGVHAQEIAPDALVKSVTEDVLDIDFARINPHAA